MNCKHREGIIYRSVRHTTESGETVEVVETVPVKGHCCRYVDARNALIPEAYKLASAEVAKLGLESAAEKNAHARSFLKYMDALAKERGLVQ